MLRSIIKVLILVTLFLGNVNAYTLPEDALMDDVEYDIAGTFGEYDFPGVSDAFDWVFTAANGKSYQLRGDEPTQDNVFGWKEVIINAPEPKWHMFQLNGDVDGDGSTKFDWILISADASEVYKLVGVQEDGTFEYSQKLNVEMNINGNKVASKQGQDESKPIGTLLEEMSEISAALLDANEEQDLLVLREEEKVARDVYLYLYDVTRLRLFSNIARAEQTHTDAVLALIEKYDLEDPAATTAQGVFKNPDLQALHDALIAQGEASLIDALIVGCTVEDVDIYDIREMKKRTDNEDILLVYESLEKGSRNHLRSFVSNLEAQGGSYTPQYLSQEEYDAIINSDMERGN